MLISLHWLQAFDIELLQGYTVGQRDKSWSITQPSSYLKLPPETV